MHIRQWLSALVTAAALAGGGVAAAGKAHAHAAKVSMETARATALAKVPGKVLSEELEKEHGRWIYSFDIRPDHPGKKKVLKEVNIDADTGEIVVIEDEKDTGK